MGATYPYLHRRGDRFFFRIGVPAELREQIGLREICRALGTGERAQAVPKALEFGAAAIRLFAALRDPCMADPKDTRQSQLTLQVLARAKAGIQQQEERSQAEAEHSELRRQILRERQEHERERELARVTGERNALQKALEASRTPLAAAEATDGAPRSQKRATAREAPSVRVLASSFLAGYGKKPAMQKKIGPALGLLSELFGNKSVSDLRQRDLVDFFGVVSRLPPKWQATCRRQGLTARELAGHEHPKLLSRKTWDDNYLVPVKLFLDWGRARHHDEGFPRDLNVETIEFDGDDDRGDRKQRSLTTAEVERLFDALAQFKSAPETEHQWWLPVLGYYTGARVNELCQLNPQTDVLTDSDEVSYIVISADTEADPRIRKSVKTGDAREVPLHPAVVQGGFLDYVKRLKKAGHKLLFPVWTPVNERASTQAEKWFRVLLRELNLRDETPGACVLGFHVFRHTLLTLAANSSPPVDAGPITGHTDQTKGKSQRGYERLSLQTKLDVLMRIQFKLSPFRTDSC